MCGEQYPDVAPTLQFVSKINLSCVNQRDGRVDAAKLQCLSKWTRQYTLETVLSDLRREMATPQNRKLQ